MTRPAVPSGRAVSTGSEAFAIDVQYYLSQEPKQLPSRYLYDALGSSLFDAICQLPWYPVTRSETRMLLAHRREIFAAASPVSRVIELGCGSGEKLARLIEGRPSSRRGLELHLVDVSPLALALSVRALGSLEDVTVTAHESAYEAGLAEVRDGPQTSGNALVLFLGSNIGNFDPPGAQEFLREIRSTLLRGDFLLLGVDLVKPEQALLEAYDDPLGVTAAFNRNLLVRINRELGGNFNLDAFAHRALWNAAESRVEMHLVSLERQTVSVEASQLEITIEKGESIWTESSYKYAPENIVSVADRAGFSCVSQWIDRDDPFALTLFEAS